MWLYSPSNLLFLLVWFFFLYTLVVFFVSAPLVDLVPFNSNQTVPHKAVVQPLQLALLAGVPLLLVHSGCLFRRALLLDDTRLLRLLLASPGCNQYLLCRQK